MPQMRRRKPSKEDVFLWILGRLQIQILSEFRLGLLRMLVLELFFVFLITLHEQLEAKEPGLSFSLKAAV